jgi:hypothetical protein
MKPMKPSNGREHHRFDLAASAVIPAIDRAFACIVRDVSLGGVYLVVDDTEVLAEVRQDQVWDLSLQGFGALVATVVRKDRKGVGLRFSDREASKAVCQALTRQLRRRYKAWIARNPANPAG